ncbi:MAG: alpha/beta hydrolase [Spirochaetia bacterium]|nr:alpha/beta hydrolase [Spirochaetia bacterium]
MKKLVKILKITGLILLLLGITGFISEFYKKNRDSKLYPPPGELVNNGKYNLHVNISGTGAYPVVIITGAGSSSYEWDKVADGLTHFTIVFRYDRAGYAWSDLPQSRLTLEDMLDNLHFVLTEKNIVCPCVFIGHSLGGLYARVFAKKYPSLAAGLILVDPRPVHFTKIIPESGYAEQHVNILLPVLKVLGPIGISRMIGESILPKNFPDKYRSFKFSIEGPKYVNIIEDEINIVTQMEEKLQNDTSYDIPAVFLVHKKSDLFPGFNDEKSRQITLKWTELQFQTSKLFKSSDVIIAEKSGHHIHLDDPGLIIQTTRDFINTNK